MKIFKRKSTNIVRVKYADITLNAFHVINFHENMDEWDTATIQKGLASRIINHIFAYDKELELCSLF
jgi:hypothetical protein